MKTLILLIVTLWLFVVLGILCTAVDAVPYGRIEVGTAPEVGAQFAEANLGYRFFFSIGGIRLKSDTYGGWLTWMVYSGSIFSPFMDIYSINQKISYKGFYTRVGHYCSHPVESNVRDVSNRDGEYLYSEFTYVGPDRWLGSTTTISVGFETEFE